MRLTSLHATTAPTNSETSHESRETVAILLLAVLAIVWVMLIRSTMSRLSAGKPIASTAAAGRVDPGAKAGATTQSKEITKGKHQPPSSPAPGREDRPDRPSRENSRENPLY